MAENNLGNMMESMFKGMENFVTSKTVVGDAVRVDDTIIIPLVDVSFGLGAGAGIKEDAHKSSGGGGIGAKMSPCAVLIIQNGAARIVNIKDQDRIARIVEAVPDLVTRFTNMAKKNPKVEEAVDKAFEGMDVESQTKNTKK